LGRELAGLDTAIAALMSHQVGLLDHFQGVPRMPRLSTGLLSGLFGQGWPNESLLLIAIGSWQLMGVGRILG
jgi:hypothetical protein